MVYHRHEMEFASSHGLRDRTSPPDRGRATVRAGPFAGPGGTPAGCEPAKRQSMVSRLGGQRRRGVAGSGSHRPQTPTLGRGPVPLGSPADRGTASPRVRNEPLDAQTHWASRRKAFWRPLSSRSCMEALRAIGLELPTAGTAARERNEAAIRRWLKHRWPRIKKSARYTSFVDFSGRKRVFRVSGGTAHVGASGANPHPRRAIQLEAAFGHCQSDNHAGGSAGGTLSATPPWFDPAAANPRLLAGLEASPAGAKGDSGVGSARGAPGRQGPSVSAETSLVADHGVPAALRPRTQSRGILLESFVWHSSGELRRRRPQAGASPSTAGRFPCTSSPSPRSGIPQTQRTL